MIIHIMYVYICIIDIILLIETQATLVGFHCSNASALFLRLPLAGNTERDPLGFCRGALPSSGMNMRIEMGLHIWTCRP